MNKKEYSFDEHENETILLLTLLICQGILDVWSFKQILNALNPDHKPFDPSTLELDFPCHFRFLPNHGLIILRGTTYTRELKRNFLRGKFMNFDKTDIEKVKNAYSKYVRILNHDDS